MSTSSNATSMAPRELHRGPPLRLGVGSAPAHHGEQALPSQYFAAHDGQQGGVDPTRIAEDHPPVAEQVAPQKIEVGHGQ